MRSAGSLAELGASAGVVDGLLTKFSKCFRREADGGCFAGNTLKPLSNQQRLHQVNTEQLFENFRSAAVHAATYRYGMRWKTVLPEQILHRHPSLGFLQKADDLLFREPLLHVRLLLQRRTLLTSFWPCLWGAGSLAKAKARKMVWIAR
jgi:hypothetical protein